MNLSHQLAKHLKDLHFGGNWTDVHLQQALEGVTWEEATQKVYDLNTIAALVYHINYYVQAIMKVVTGKPLDSSDKYSFDVVPVNSEEDWKVLKDKSSQDTETLCNLIAVLPEPKLWETFSDPKYGTYYRNIQGLIEHSHYHLGQIVIIKKILKQRAGALMSQ